MSKQRFLGGLLGANPVRDGSFTHEVPGSEVTLDPTRINTGISEPAGDLELTKVNGANTGWGLGQVNAPIVAGDKKYFEVWMRDFVDGKGMVGVCTTDHPVNYNIGSAGGWSIGYYGQLGQVFCNGTVIYDNIEWDNDIVSCAVDFDAGKVWYAVNGSWITGNPSTGSGGFSYSTAATLAAASEVYFCVSLQEDTGTMDINPGTNGTFNGQKTAQGNTDANGNGDFFYAVPTGFTMVGNPSTSSDRTTSNVGIVSLDEAGPEANGDRDITQINWGGIRGRDAVVGSGPLKLANTGILSLSELLQASYELVTVAPEAEPGGVYAENIGTSSDRTVTWTVPADVNFIHAVTVGGGGGAGRSNSGLSGSAGGGGALRYKNSIPVTPGEVLTIVAGRRGRGGVNATGGSGQAGGQSRVERADGTILVAANGGAGGSKGGSATNTRPGGSGPAAYDGGGNGGSGGRGNYTLAGGGGGGAGGYSANGGHGGRVVTNTTYVGSNGFGGSGGGGGVHTSSGSGGGGGVGLYGEGANGTGGGNSAGNSTATGGGGGSGGNNGGTGGGTGGLRYGGGAGAKDDDLTTNGAAGGMGAVRIIWGSTRSFPSTDVDLSSSTAGETKL